MTETLHLWVLLAAMVPVVFTLIHQNAGGPAPFRKVMALALLVYVIAFVAIAVGRLFAVWPVRYLFLVQQYAAIGYFAAHAARLWILFDRQPGPGE